MNKTTILSLPLLCLGVAACAGASESQSAGVEQEGRSRHETLPAGHNPSGQLTSEGVTGTTEVTYHGGGTVMHGGVNVYLIWYGAWSGNTATTILPDLVSNLGGSSWFDINTSYSDGTGSVKNSVTYAGSTTDAYSQGAALGIGGVEQVVKTAISNGSLPGDSNGVYFVLSSSDVSEQSTTSETFCGSYCGWHNYYTSGTTHYKFAFVGDGSRCPSACEAQSSSPNGNAGADAMASVMAHELSESVTDPLLDAWFDSDGNENADKCAWNWGTTYKPSSGVYANVKLGSRDFLIQQNWVNSSNGYCANGYSAASTLLSGTTLSAGQSVSSADARFSLTMQSDGNLVLYWSGHSGALWASGTSGKGGTEAIMQTDGNLVIYTAAGKAVWSSRTNGNSGAGLVVQSDGNVVIYDNGKALWASGTCCH